MEARFPRGCGEASPVTALPSGSDDWLFSAAFNVPVRSRTARVNIYAAPGFRRQELGPSAEMGPSGPLSSGGSKGPFLSSNKHRSVMGQGPYRKRQDVFTRDIYLVQTNCILVQSTSDLGHQPAAAIAMVVTNTDLQVQSPWSRMDHSVQSPSSRSRERDGTVSLTCRPTFCLESPTPHQNVAP